MKVENLEINGVRSSVLSIGNSYGKELSYDRAKQVASNLIKKGLHSGECNFLTGITISFDVTASIKWWVEAERYHWFQIVMSESTMHSISSLLGKDDAFVGYVAPEVREAMKIVLDRWKENKEDSEIRRQLLYSCPVGLQLKAHVTTNALQIATMMNQRENHFLPEWEEFISFMDEGIDLTFIDGGLHADK